MISDLKEAYSDRLGRKPIRHDSLLAAASTGQVSFEPSFAPVGLK